VGNQLDLADRIEPVDLRTSSSKARMTSSMGVIWSQMCSQ
jgi:hypothetical protein